MLPVPEGSGASLKSIQFESALFVNSIEHRERNAERATPVAVPHDSDAIARRRFEYHRRAIAIDRARMPGKLVPAIIEDAPAEAILRILK